MRVLTMGVVLVVYALAFGCRRHPVDSSGSPPLTNADIQISDDNKLDERIREKAFGISEGKGSRGLRMVYSTALVEDEVNNGGFNQYFWNTDGESAQDALSGFGLIGASKHAAIMKEAIDIWRTEKTQMERFKSSNSLQDFSDSYKHTKLNPLDDRFYKLESEENLTALRAKYVRSRPQEFVGK